MFCPRVETPGMAPMWMARGYGRWVERQVDGTSNEGPYVEDKRHGRWTVFQRDGTSNEGPYIKGRRHGRWFVRERDGNITVQTFANGKLVRTE